MSDVRTESFEIVCPDTTKLERPKWLGLRKRIGDCPVFGSSDAAPSLNLSPWRCQYEMWAEKSGLIEDRPDNDRFEGGRMYEEPTLRLWSMRTGRDFDSLQRHLMLRSLAYPYMVANPDALSDDAVIEVKTAHSMDEKRWNDGIPDQYVIQGLHLCAVSGRRKCIFPVAFTFEGPREFVIDLDDPTPTEDGGTRGEELEASMSALIVIEAEMHRRVVENDPPDPDGSESAMMALREQFFAVEYGSVVQLPQSVKQLLLERSVEVDAAKAHTKRADEIKSKLMQLLGNAEAGELDGEIVCTWRAGKDGGRRFLFTEAGK